MSLFSLYKKLLFVYNSVHLPLRKKRGKKNNKLTSTDVICVRLTYLKNSQFTFSYSRECKFFR